MEKYTRLLLANPSNIPKDVKLYVPIMKRLNEMTDDEIRQRVFSKQRGSWGEKAVRAFKARSIVADS